MVEIFKSYTNDNLGMVYPHVICTDDNFEFFSKFFGESPGGLYKATTKEEKETLKGGRSD